MNRPAPLRNASAERTPRRRTADGAAKALLLCFGLAALALAGGRWRASALAVRVDAAEPSRAAAGELVASPEAFVDAEPSAGRLDDPGRFQLDPQLATYLDSIAAGTDTELVVCLLDGGTKVVPRQSVVAPLGARLEEDCPPDSFAVWHNHPASAAAPHAACSLSTLDVELVLRMRPRWAVVQAQHGERCWWSYGQVVQHTLISRERLAPLDTQLVRVPGI